MEWEAYCHDGRASSPVLEALPINTSSIRKRLSGPIDNLQFALEAKGTIEGILKGGGSVTPGGIVNIIMTRKTELSAAEQYARLKTDRFEAFMEASFSDEALKGVDLYEVKTESGMTFKCRKVDAAFAANTGQMPMALTESLITKHGTEEEMVGRFNEMSDTEKRASLQATANMVRYVCVDPRLIVGDVGNRTNAISVDLLTMDDFKSLVEWAKTGGGAASGLKTFRSKRK